MLSLLSLLRSNLKKRIAKYPCIQYSARLAIAATITISSYANALEATSATEGLKGKLVVGYQGWFGCPNDFDGNQAWQHWFVKSVKPEFLTVDMLPAMDGIHTEDQCDTNLPRADGNGSVKLFSSQNPRVVDAHFRWMREHGIEVVALQRFVAGLNDIKKKKRFDNVLMNVQKAAENHKRIFFITYDISGANPGTVVDDIRKDWKYLSSILQLQNNPQYLHDKGKPILQLWGFGFKDRPGNADEVSLLIHDLKKGRGDLTAVTLIGGVPTSWRTASNDSKAEAQWADVYRSYDVVSPWSVGRFKDDDGLQVFINKYVAPDLAETKRLGLGYMPVIFPGFSWYNLMTNRGQPKSAKLNEMPRKCGQFLWAQAAGMMGAGVDTLYAAMFDEMDEATALLPTLAWPSELPKDSTMLTLNQDGCLLPEDWYLHITGLAADKLRKSELPSRKLMDVSR
jgi:hypothetical protein